MLPKFRLPPTRLAKWETWESYYCTEHTASLPLHQSVNTSHGSYTRRLERTLSGTLTRSAPRTSNTLVWNRVGLQSVECSRGRIHQAPACWGRRVVRRQGASPGRVFWLVAVVSLWKTAAAQCTGQRRVVPAPGRKPWVGILAGSGCFLMENRSCSVYWAAPGGSGPRTKVLGALTMVAGCQVVADSPPPSLFPLPVRDKVPP